MARPVRDAVIVDALRTPFGKRNGSFKDTHPEVLAALPLRALGERLGLTGKDVDDVIYGNVTPVGEQGLNVARKAALLAGWGDVVPGVQLNRMCGSGQQAINFAAQGVMSGASDVVVAGGVEHMTRVPIGSDAGPVSEALADAYEILHQGESAERIADKWGFTREDLDRFAVESQRRYAKAAEAGHYKPQIVPARVKVDGNEVVVERDEHPRPTTTLEGLAKLKPSFRPDNGRLHAGNSSGIVDGAAAVVVTTPEVARERGWTPKARIVAQASVGSDPVLMLTGPIPATEKVLRRANLTIHDIDLFECNEAFASVPMAWMKDTGAPWEKVNTMGGAIAHGHPLGATGAMLVTKLVHELERTGKRYGMSTMCIGFGQGIATIVERL
ncbi:MAG TPA: thiolase family protein [Candidatus Thermoplasmatota archaeon]|nr:thiolase family protein [Candidatus Thermoplasmatota archaeon]